MDNAPSADIAPAGRIRTRARLQRRRKLWLKVHLWLGLGLGAFLAIFGLTGSVLVFQSELDRLLNAHLFYSKVPQGATPRPLSEIAQALERSAPPGWESAGTVLPSKPGENYLFGLWYPEPTPAPERAVSLNIAINPFTAQVVGRRVFYHASNPFKHCLIGFFFKLHYELVAGPTGVTVVGAMALVLVISTLTGLILWWPLDGRWRRVLTIKRATGGVRLNHDIHQTAGFYLLAVLLAVLVSGVSFNLPDDFKDAVSAFSPVTEPPGRPAPANAPAADLDRMLAAADRVYPGAKPAYLQLPDPATGLMNVCFQDVPELKSRLIDTGCVWVDAASGSVLRADDVEHGSAGDVFMRWQWPLHSGQAFGWTGRILVFVCGLACPLLFATGVIRWLQKRSARAAVTSRFKPLRQVRARAWP